MSDKKLIDIETAARACGFKLSVFERRLNLPPEHPHAFKHLVLIDNKFLDLDKINDFIAHSKPRQGQAPIVTDEIIKQQLEILSCMYEGKKRAAMLVLSFFGGMRVGEIAGLKIGDVMASRDNVKDMGILFRASTKTKKQREIFLAHPAIKEYLLPYAKRRLEDGANMKDRLFVTIKNKPFKAQYLAVYFKRIYKAIDLPECSSHTGRAACVVRQLRRGKGLKYAAKYVGHESINTTALYDRAYASDIIDDLHNEEW